MGVHHRAPRSGRGFGGRQQGHGLRVPLEPRPDGDAGDAGVDVRRRLQGNARAADRNVEPGQPLHGARRHAEAAGRRDRGPEAHLSRCGSHQQHLEPRAMTHLTGVDYAVMLLYFVFVLGIGVTLKRSVKTSEDFFLSGRSLPPWVTGLAFVSANLGAQEVIGMGASGAKYGIATSHFYWIGAIPAMVFIGLFMMPFYYGSRARSVPEYLKLRFDEKTRALNAVSFAVMTVFSSGISLYAMGKLLNLLLGWSFNASILVAAGIVLAYIFLGGLTSAIYNEVLQFCLIVLGFAPLVFLGLRAVGGWSGLVARLAEHSTARGFAPGAYTHSWAYMGHASANPVGVEWFSLVMGLGFVLSFGYWCTDFLVVQRAMAANSMTAARRTPLIAAFPKMVFPFLVILPGMLALVVSPASGVRRAEPAAVTASTTSTTSTTSDR